MDDSGFTWWKPDSTEYELGPLFPDGSRSPTPPSDPLPSASPSPVPMHSDPPSVPLATMFPGGFSHCEHPLRLGVQIGDDRDSNGGIIQNVETKCFFGVRTPSPELHTVHFADRVTPKDVCWVTEDSVPITPIFWTPWCTKHMKETQSPSLRDSILELADQNPNIEREDSPVASHSVLDVFNRSNTDLRGTSVFGQCVEEWSSVWYAEPKQGTGQQDLRQLLRKDSPPPTPPKHNKSRVTPVEEVPDNCKDEWLMMMAAILDIGMPGVISGLWTHQIGVHNPMDPNHWPQVRFLGKCGYQENLDWHMISAHPDVDCVPGSLVPTVHSETGEPMPWQVNILWWLVRHMYPAPGGPCKSELHSLDELQREYVGISA